MRKPLQGDWAWDLSAFLLESLEKAILSSVILFLGPRIGLPWSQKAGSSPADRPRTIKKGAHPPIIGLYPFLALHNLLFLDVYSQWLR
ncbi:hypothetical protein BS50DRAFT_311255 [Corynespora cassiicola Philippines]|uniref:Uncharacterized protein n=1 Tax=Corynespora cassiicola Philippines TaxID=1448308 RepID=A0A2T2NYL0_CORCC|nr:hypothetical protein BS50DRAFT_311255 [Corynespora cassiicola Philippines]